MVISKTVNRSDGFRSNGELESTARRHEYKYAPPIGGTEFFAQPDPDDARSGPVGHKKEEKCNLERGALRR